MKTWLAVLAIGVVAGTAHAERDRVDLIGEGAAKSNAGDHAAAIALYEEAYLNDPDPALLPILATEYRHVGLPNDAITYFCQYLTAQPKGSQATYARSQVIAIRGELGQRISNDRVCETPRPVQVDFLTPRPSREPSRPSMSKREIAGIASATLGAASLAVAVYYGAKAKSISDDITSHGTNESWPENIGALEARGQRYESRQNMFLLVGGAAIVTGGILYFVGRADRLSSETIVAPTVSSSGAGISFTRGF